LFDRYDFNKFRGSYNFVRDCVNVLSGLRAKRIAFDREEKHMQKESTAVLETDHICRNLQHNCSDSIYVRGLYHFRDKLIKH